MADPTGATGPNFWFILESKNWDDDANLLKTNGFEFQSAQPIYRKDSQECTFRIATKVIGLVPEAKIPLLKDIFPSQLQHTFPHAQKKEKTKSDFRKGWYWYKVKLPAHLFSIGNECLEELKKEGIIDHKIEAAFVKSGEFNVVNLRLTPEKALAVWQKAYVCDIEPMEQLRRSKSASLLSSLKKKLVIGYSISST